MFTNLNINETALSKIFAELSITFFLNKKEY